MMVESGWHTKCPLQRLEALLEVGQRLSLSFLGAGTNRTDQTYGSQTSYKVHLIKEMIAQEKSTSP